MTRAVEANPYAPQVARLSRVIDETPTIKTFCFDLEKPLEFRAGQFIQLGVPGLGEAPFTPSSSPLEPGHLEVTVLKTGGVTERLHRMAEGDICTLRGPYGKGYPVEKLEGRDVVVVGGGVGLAPLRALIYQLFSMTDRLGKVVIKNGARESAELLFRRQYAQWAARDKVTFEATIDNAQAGWDGHVGVVTTILENLPAEVDVPNAYAFTCGPEIMLRFVTFTLIEKGFDAEHIYLSMNRRMSCGVGKCGRCNVGPHYLCKDGPDMCYAKVKDYPNVF
ncbi:MAG TPA: FAD/NAD(P)-binding protein [Phycisphaerae bacterium]|nr:FAD/NAD(P)-binding protein [Phycisphaerae bacterium]